MERRSHFILIPAMQCVFAGYFRKEKNISLQNFRKKSKR